MPKNHETGRRGEEIAIDFYRGLGYTILVHNYRMRGGEIDLIASKGDTLFFVEVKTRTSTRFMMAREAVEQRKQARIILAAQHYLMKKPWDGPCQFDVIEVYLECGMPLYVNHLPDAFGL